MVFCEEVEDKSKSLGFSATIRRAREGGKVGADRKKTAPEIRRTKAVGGGKTEPDKPYKTRKDAGQQRGSSAPSPGKPKGAVELKPGTAGTQGSAAMSAKERQRKAYLERKAKEGGKEQPKTASQAISQAKPQQEKKPEAAAPRRQWKTETGAPMTRAERDAARNKEKTTKAQETKKSATEILAQMRREYEEKGGKWNSKVAVQMRAKAKAAAKAAHQRRTTAGPNASPKYLSQLQSMKKAQASSSKNSGDDDGSSFSNMFGMMMMRCV